MSEPFIGEIRMAGFNFAPRGWALCDGQLLPIAPYTALFSLLGTTFGGNGQTNFALPDLRGRVPLHQGQGPGLTDRIMGELSGEQSVTLHTSQMPMHTHLVNAHTGVGSVTTAGDQFIASPLDPGTRDPLPSFSPTADTVMNPMTNGISGGNEPHDNMQPYLCVNFIISLEGIFPSRA
ncbi:MAG: tail fiber protein [Methylovulum sp.]|nr:tail fiber protein [Methylovulum sp.]